jgi:uncharacterized protein YbjT (DUF2867 family)
MSASAAAFVAGATGYTGRHVVAELRRRGIATIAHVRPDSPALPAWRTHFEALGATVDATPWVESQIAARLHEREPGYIFSLLGTTQARGRRSARGGVIENYETVDYGLTAMLIRAAVAAGAAPRFVYLSAVGVRERVASRYLQARWRAESLLRASGLPYTIARRSFITGIDRDEVRPLERASARLLDGFLAAASALGARQLRARFRSTTGAALACALVRAALDPAAENIVVESEALR